MSLSTYAVAVGEAIADSGMSHNDDVLVAVTVFSDISSGGKETPRRGSLVDAPVGMLNVGVVLTEKKLEISVWQS